MKFKSVAAGAIAALGLGLMAVPAQAFVFGYYASGASLEINGGAENSLAGGFSIIQDVNPTTGNVSMGWYNSNGYHDVTNENYLASRIGDPDTPGTLGNNNFFVFDLTDYAAAT